MCVEIRMRGGLACDTKCSNRRRVPRPPRRTPRQTWTCAVCGLPPSTESQACRGPSTRSLSWPECITRTALWQYGRLQRAIVEISAYSMGAHPFPSTTTGWLWKKIGPLYKCQNVRISLPANHRRNRSSAVNKNCLGGRLRMKPLRGNGALATRRLKQRCNRFNAKSSRRLLRFSGRRCAFVTAQRETHYC